jgi:hypothetical protein
MMKPAAMGSQNVSPRKASVITVACSIGIPNDAKTSGVTPSTTPIPWGVIEMFQNKIAIA